LGIFLILLYRGLIRSVLEYTGAVKGSVPRIKGYIGSDGIYTEYSCLGVLSGIPLLAKRFAYLNFR
jgi:hypothetical protein